MIRSSEVDVAAALLMVVVTCQCRLQWQAQIAEDLQDEENVVHREGIFHQCLGRRRSNHLRQRCLSIVAGWEGDLRLGNFLVGTACALGT